MKIGFTGTRKGMTGWQLIMVRQILKDEIGKMRAKHETEYEFHHGCCLGADAQAHDIARDLGYTIVIHPPIRKHYEAPCIGDEYRKEKSYLQRNHDIVDETNYLIATPYQIHEVLRSGSWATIRYAKKQGKKVINLLKRS